MKFVCDNYNLSTFRAYVNVTPGTYEEKLQFGSYSASTGEIYIRSSDSTQKVNIKNPNTTTISLSITQGNYTFENFNIINNISTENVTRSNTVVSCVYVSSYASVLFLKCDFTFNVNQESKLSSFNGRMLWVGSYGIIEVQEGTSISSNNSTGFSVNAVFASSGGKFNFLGASTQTYCYISGDFSTVINTNNGVIQANNNGPIYDVVITTRQGEQCTGRRYYAQEGGSISTLGGGPDFFPGTTAGSVDASTYSWYK